MALMPLAFDIRSDNTTRMSHNRLPTSSANPMDRRMPSSRGNTSPHHFSTGHAVRSPGDRISPSLLEQVSPREFSQEAHSAKVLSDHMTGEPFHNAAPMHPQSPLKSKANSHRRRRKPDFSLIAMGSWSSQSYYRDGERTRIEHLGSLASINDDIVATNLPMDSSSSSVMDDFILIPDDTAEDALVQYEEASPPRAPHGDRLRTPYIAPMSTDVQFFPCLGDEREEDRINDTWYLAGREKVDSQRQCQSETHDLASGCFDLTVRD